MTQSVLPGKRIGVAFGGYVPLHNGHLDLLNRAINENDGCIIVVGGTEEPEERGVRIGLPVRKRYEYVRDYFANNPDVRVVECNETKLGIQKYPNGWDSWMQWSQPVIHKLAPHAEIITWYSGEANHEAELKKRFVLPVKNKVVIVEHVNPISGTKIRENPEEHFDQITNPFKATFRS